MYYILHMKYILYHPILYLYNPIHMKHYEKANHGDRK